MQMKKLIAIGTLSMTAAAVMLAGCSSTKPEDKAADKPAAKQASNEASNVNATGLPIAKEKATLHLVAFTPTNGKDLNDYPFFQEAEKKTNVHIDWNMNPGGSAWKEKKNLLFASGELPDAFYGHGILDESSDVVKYGSQGVLIPLEDLIDNYAPNIKALFAKNPEYKKMLTAPDGHIYSLPTIDESYAKSKPALFINKKWLDQLKLPLPTTTEQFYDTLKAFKDQDANGNGKADEIPLTFRSEDWNADLASFFGSFGLVDRRDHIAVKDGKVMYTAIQPEYEQAIEYFHRLFGAGLADKESFTQDSKVFSAKISKNNTVGAFIAWNTNSVGLPLDTSFVALPPLKGPNGQQMWAGFTPGILFKGSFAITSANKKPELSMRWIDYMFDPVVSLQAVNGMIGSNLKQLPDGNYQTIPAPEGVSVNEFRTSPETSRSVWAMTQDMKDKMVPGAKTTKYTKEELDALYGPFLVYNEYPKVYFTAEENDQIAKYSTDIGTYASKMYATWMLDGGIDKQWDGYVKKLKDMGLDQMLQVYQKAYDRYNAVK